MPKKKEVERKVLTNKLKECSDNKKALVKKINLTVSDIEEELKSCLILGNRVIRKMKDNIDDLTDSQMRFLISYGNMLEKIRKDERDYQLDVLKLELEKQKEEKVNYFLDKEEELQKLFDEYEIVQD